MKLVHRKIEKGNGWESAERRESSTNQNENKKTIFFSSVVLVPEEPEDMWHAYNIIASGDVVRASTIRKVSYVMTSNWDILTKVDSFKVQNETATGSSSSSRVRTTLTIKVETIDYDTQACMLRLKGRNIEENQYVKVSSGWFTCIIQVSTDQQPVVLFYADGCLSYNRFRAKPQVWNIEARMGLDLSWTSRRCLWCYTKRWCSRCHHARRNRTHLSHNIKHDNRKKQDWHGNSEETKEQSVATRKGEWKLDRNRFVLTFYMISLLRA